MPQKTDTVVEAVIIPPEDHPVTPDSLSANARKVLTRLQEGGHAAYLVGGGVRDALVGLKPKDFDVATDASPEEVRALFRNSRIIGRRFRLVHVVFGRDIIEVATFRAAHDKGDGGEVGQSGRIVRDNVFGTIEEDALRRDFSVNALYYSLADETVLDFVGGRADIETGLFRLIGDPLTRCAEDPVRALRAVRLAAKLDFGIEPDTLAAMQKISPELANTAPARLFEEVLKLFQGGYAQQSFAGVVEHDMLQYLFPMLATRLSAMPAGEESQLRTLLDSALANTDRRVAQNKPITPAYLLAFMLWPDVEEQAMALVAEGLSVNDALHEAADEVMAVQLKSISIPRRFSGPMREIWLFQPRLEQWRGARALKLLENRRFRAAYDFLCLRASINPALQPMADWWTNVQDVSADEQESMAADMPTIESPWGTSSKPSRKRRRTRSTRADSDGHSGDGDSGSDEDNSSNEAGDEAGNSAEPAQAGGERQRRKRSGRKRRSGTREPKAADASDEAGNEATADVDGEAGTRDDVAANADAEPQSETVEPTATRAGKPRGKKRQAARTSVPERGNEARGKRESNQDGNRARKPKTQDQSDDAGNRAAKPRRGAANLDDDFGNRAPAGRQGGSDSGNRAPGRGRKSGGNQSGANGNVAGGQQGGNARGKSGGGRRQGRNGGGQGHSQGQGQAWAQGEPSARALGFEPPEVHHGVVVDSIDSGPRAELQLYTRIDPETGEIDGNVAPDAEGARLRKPTSKPNNRSSGNRAPGNRAPGNRGSGNRTPGNRSTGGKPSGRRQSRPQQRRKPQGR